MINRYIYSIAVTLLFAGCSKEIEVKSPDFDVTVSGKNGTGGESYSTADTLEFIFKGNPDFITFYSGEVGRRYEYKDRLSADGSPVLQFSTLRANGTQAGSLALMISADFKGVVLKPGSAVRDTAATNANIAAASWQDISDRAAFSAGSTMSSGAVDLSDFADRNKSVFIAFKYTGNTGSIQNKWTITGLNVTNALDDGTSYTIASLAAPGTAIPNYGNTTYSPGWAVSYDPALNAGQYGWVFTAGTSLVITGAATAAAATSPAEAWAVMGPLDLKKVSPDLGVPVKSIALKLEKYSYKYTSANNSRITFVASNNSPDQSERKVKELNITIKP